MREWVETGAQVVLALAAWRALSTWRLQLRGGDEYEIARRLRHTTCRLRRETRRARNAFFPVAELEQALASNGVSDPDQVAQAGTDAQEHALVRRMQRIHELRAEFEDAAIDAEVYWDDKAVEMLTPMRRVVADVLGRLDECRDMLAYRSSSDPEMQKERRRIWREAFSDNPLEQPDRLDQDLEAAVRAVAKFLKPKLGQPRQWWRWVR